MKIEWGLNSKDLLGAARLQAQTDSEPGDSIDASLLKTLLGPAEAWKVQASGFRLFSPGGKSVSFYDAEGRRIGKSELRRGPYRPGKSFEGELGRALDELHALVPLSEIWSWRAPEGGSHAAFVLAKPIAWPQLLSLSLLAPLGPVLRSLAATPDCKATAFAFSGEAMELVVLPPGPPAPASPPAPALHA